MTQQEILEYNKRCAEFLGITEGCFKDELDCSNITYEWMAVSATCSYKMNDKEGSTKTAYDYLKFHSDWNWIMEVLDKIYSTKIYYSKYIPENASQFEDGSIQITTKKETVVEAINQFLIWYEKQKES